jgi:hypothetical protein
MLALLERTSTMYNMKVGFWEGQYEQTEYSKDGADRRLSRLRNEHQVTETFTPGQPFARIPNLFRLSWWDWRDAEYGKAFMLDLVSRLKYRVQLTTDGHKVYLNAVENAFGCDIDYAMLIKVYGKATQEDERKYSPVECTGAEIVPVTASLMKSIFQQAMLSGKTSPCV